MTDKLKVKIEEIENLIKENSKDANNAGVLLEELRLEYKKDVPAMELSVPTESVINEVDGGSFVIKECEDGILLHIRGGYDVFVQPRMTALYKHLIYLLRTREKYDELTEDQKQVFDAAYHATIVNMEIPIFMAVDDRYFFQIAEKALSCLNELADATINNATLQPETPIENAEFANMMDVMQEAEKNLDKSEPTLFDS